MTMSRDLLSFLSPSATTGGVRALLFTLLLLVPAVAGLAVAQGFTAALGGGVATRYNWRGLDFGAGASVQPYLRCEFHGFKGGF